MSTKAPVKKGFAWARFFIWTGLVIGFLLLILIVMAVLFEDKIAGYVIDKLRASLRTELKVERAELSLIRRFPSATVRLKNLELKGTMGEQPLAKIGQLSLECGIFGLLSGNYEFHAISISDAEFYAMKDKKGKVNYDVWISDTTSTESDPLALSIQRTNLSNVRVHYIDQKIKQDFDFTVEDGYFSGKFSDELFTMDSYAELLSHKMQVGDDVYLEGKKMAYDAVLEIDNLKKTYNFKDIKLNFEANEFTVQGDMAMTEEGLQFNKVELKSQETSLNSVLKMMPKRYLRYLEGFDSYANLYFNAKINGLLSEKRSPVMEVEFGLKDGRVSHLDMASSLKGVSFDIRYSNGDGKNPETAVFTLENFKANLDGNPIQCRLTSKGSTNPLIDFGLNGKFSLAGMYGWFGKGVSAGTGDILVEQLTLQGRYKDMQTVAGIPQVKFNGLVSFNGANVTSNGVDIGIERGAIAINQNDLTLSDLMLKAVDSDVLLYGVFRNVLPVFFADSTNSKNAQLEIEAHLNSKMLDVDKIITAFTPKTTTTVDTTAATTTAPQESAGMESWSQFLFGRIIANVEKIHYGKIDATMFNGIFDFENSLLKIKSLKLNAMEGELELNSKIYLTNAPQIEAYLDCHNLDVEQFLAQCDNFGQENLKDRHLHGRLTSLFKVEAFWDEQGNFLTDKLFVVADVLLQDGELIGFEPLERFSAFIKIQDLRHIKFVDLRNQFRIEKSAFYMPAMFIRSNALNVIVSGYHSFNQDIDYKLKINVDQVIAQKFKKFNPELTAIKAKQNGLFNFYGRITGNVTKGDYKFKKGKKDVKEPLEAELNRELPLLANQLRDEFSQSFGLADPSGQLIQDIQSKLTELRQNSEWEDLSDDETGSDTGEW